MTVTFHHGYPYSQRGMVSVIALMLLGAIVTLILTLTLRISSTGINNSLNQSSNVAALFLAESGLEYATQRLSSGAENCGAMVASTQSFGRGSYTVDSSFATDYDGVTALSAGQCRVQVTGAVNNTSVTRTVQAVLSTSGGGGGGIVVDNASARARNNTSSFTISHTVAGTNRLMVVGIVLRDNTNQTVTGVSYAGVAFDSTLKLVSEHASDLRVEMWYLVNPTPGSNNISITLSANARVVAGATSFTGVDQSNPVGVTNTNTGSNWFPSVNVVTDTDNAWVIDTFGGLNRVFAPAVGANQTQQWSDANNGGGFFGSNRVRGAASVEGPQSPAGAVTMSWTYFSFPAHWAMAAMQINPASGSSIGVLSWRELTQ